MISNTIQRLFKLIKWIVWLSILCACIAVFVFTPFYSKSILFLLNHIVPIEVNVVAARSQQIAALSEHNDLEPGSALWIARQAYLKVLQDAAQKEDINSLNMIAQRYQILEKQIQKNILDTGGDEQSASEVLHTTPVSGSHVGQKQHMSLKQKMQQDVRTISTTYSDENTQAMIDKYDYFLKHYPIDKPVLPITDQTTQELKKLSTVTEVKTDPSKPSAIIVLGGGLTLDKTTKKIMVNNYTRLRLETILQIEKQNPLPILLSGVEAPYMQAWLKTRGVDANLLENRSMNTCENSRFSSLLLQKKGGAPNVILITDAYHMPRTRRLFALNGIATVPVSAPMPEPLTTWQPALQNYDHSRRANYELLATVRDMLFGTSDCREVP
ncbi:YdcF family protein [Acinetobacter rathckeae]|uniref:YdcF family protein n=1 Tax=Acinetobacter rathckeae TaxID=2605272 RepID=UPI0018A261BA|nr:YdcF family protein [Acinetobacter rathckeae]MBF7687302.1 YdcF family protein [Acinetobacter rathckeae]MBF7694345.1 YdcF family protein [Acinetobacter rathckeae]